MVPTNLVLLAVKKSRPICRRAYLIFSLSQVSANSDLSGTVGITLNKKIKKIKTSHWSVQPDLAPAQPETCILEKVEERHGTYQKGSSGLSRDTHMAYITPAEKVHCFNSSP